MLFSLEFLSKYAISGRRTDAFPECTGKSHGFCNRLQETQAVDWRRHYFDIAKYRTLFLMFSFMYNQLSLVDVYLKTQNFCDNGVKFSTVKMHLYLESVYMYGKLVYLI